MKKYIAAVLGAGFCWGFMGVFTRHLADYGIDSTGAIIVRCSIAALCFGILILCTGAKQFKVKLRDVWCFLGSGLLSLLFFTFCYFNAINLMSLSTSAILLYTAPTIVMLLSAVLFKEKLTAQKLIAVVLAFAGCCLVSGITGGVKISLQGLLFGLGSGLGYALYTIFSRFALMRGYSSSTVNFYSCLLAALGALCIWGPHGTFAAMVSSPMAVVWCLAVGAVSCFVPYLLYTFSLTGLENGKASVLSSVEPVVATLLGVLLYRERMTVPALCGVLLVLGAVVLLNIKIGKPSPRKKE